MVEFSSNQVRYVASAYDSTNDKIVVAYRETAAGPDVGMAVVGTVSGTSISFGTPVQFEAGTTNYIDIVFDPDTSKVIIAYEDDTNSSYGTAIVGTVSGTSISFGTAVVFSSFNTRYTSIIYDTNVDRIAIAFTKYDGFQQGWGIAGQVSGTSISFGSAVRFDTDNSSFTVEMIDLTFDSTNNKVINIYKGNNNRFQGVIGTISGTAISWGTPVDVNTSTDNRFPSGSFDTNAGKIFIAYKDSATDYVLGVVGTVSGTSISFGTAVTLASVGVNGEVSAAYNPDTQNHKVIYGSLVSPFPIRQFTATVSGTSVSASGDRAVTSDQGQVYQSGLTYDTNTNQFVSASRTTSSEVGGGLVYVSPAGASNTDFIGITDQAIADTATGAVIVQGGVITNTGLVPDSVSANTAVAYESGNVSNAQQRIVYDTANNKAVVLYIDQGNSSYLTAVVGTVSGAAISFGTPVVIQSNEVDSIALTYDENAQKVVAAYKNNVSPFPGRAKVGTVSGTSISFGSAGDFHTGSIAGTDATYDSTSQKVILSYGSSAGGHLIVGTISGTSISFGTEYDFTASEITQTAVTYDTNAQKVVLAYTDSGNSSYGTAAVGTVSGTSISVGSTTVFVNAVVAPVYVKYEPVAQKVVVAYANRGVSPPDWSARVGTVSGTTISFGTETVAGSSGFNGGLTFDTSTGHMIQAYQEASNGTSPVIQISTVSGTDITFGGSLSVSTSTSAAILRIAYDPDTSQVIGINRVDSSSAVARTFNVNQGLTTSSDYYVQADGSLSTTVSSVPAGRALSTTSILLEG
jgi:hypothetical protein